MELVALIEDRDVLRNNALIARNAIHVISRSVVLSNYRVKGEDSSKIALGCNLFDNSPKRQNPVCESADVAILDGDAENVGGLPAHNSEDCFNTAGIARRGRRASVPYVVANDPSRNAEAIEIEGNVIRLHQDSGGVHWNNKIADQLITSGRRDFEWKTASILNAGLIDQNSLVRILVVCCEDLQ